ncbi:MAG: hypothetical protein JW889_00900 [Verrucomicrobia bacterium]|nr:hypothetical protein [Verrucomicrobiota bacterium]
MQRLLGAVIVCVALGAMLDVGPTAAATDGTGVYEDPLGRYRFSFTGAWHVSADEADPGALDHFYLVRDGKVAAELIVSAEPFPMNMRLQDFVDDQVKVLDADPGMFRVSLRRDLTIAKQSATCLIARRVLQPQDGPRQETLIIQYWFVKGRALWSLLMLATPAEEQRAKLVEQFEETVAATFEPLEPDAVAQAIAASKKTARLGNGLAEITLPERWTLLSAEDDLVVADFDKGRLYLFAVPNHEYGETLDEIAYAFLEHNGGLADPEVHIETECTVAGVPGYGLIFTGTKGGRAFTVQVIALTKDTDAFFLYGIAESGAWRAAQPWITAVQYTIKLFDKTLPAKDGLNSNEADDAADGSPTDPL